MHAPLLARGRIDKIGFAESGSEDMGGRRWVAGMAIVLGLVAAGSVAGAQTQIQTLPAPGAVAPGAVPSERVDEPTLDLRHEGYYYPSITSREVYGARASTLKDATRATRIGFVTGLTQQQLGKPYAPPFALFAKGERAEKLIIVSLGDHGFRSIYQARALLAQLTAVSRTTPLLREMQVEELYTFFDLLKLMGFEQLTISDGETFAHQVILE